MKRRVAIRAFLAGVGLMFCAAAAPVATAADDSQTVLVFAAASLTDVLDELGKAFTAQTHIQVKSSLAASSALAKQIEAGAPADVFFSADLDWMDYLDQRKLLQAGTRHDVVGNKLVLIAPADSKVAIKIGPGVDLHAALGPEGKLATGDP